ncbi:unnamed protein product, partial [Trichogramma brassicae]
NSRRLEKAFVPREFITRIGRRPQYCYTQNQHINHVKTYRLCEIENNLIDDVVMVFVASRVLEPSRRSCPTSVGPEVADACSMPTSSTLDSPVWSTHLVLCDTDAAYIRQAESVQNIGEPACAYQRATTPLLQTRRT